MYNVKAGVQARGAQIRAVASDPNDQDKLILGLIGENKRLKKDLQTCELELIKCRQGASKVDAENKQVGNEAELQELAAELDKTLAFMQQELEKVAQENKVLKQNNTVLVAELQKTKDSLNVQAARADELEKYKSDLKNKVQKLKNEAKKVQGEFLDIHTDLEIMEGQMQLYLEHLQEENNKLQNDYKLAINKLTEENVARHEKDNLERAQLIQRLQGECASKITSEKSKWNSDHEAEVPYFRYQAVGPRIGGGP
jgi:chromosome segregation ATPase